MRPKNKVTARKCDHAGHRQRQGQQQLRHGLRRKISLISQLTIMGTMTADAGWSASMARKSRTLSSPHWVPT